MGTGNNGGGPDPILTEDRIPFVLEHLRHAGGIKAVAAQNMGISRATLHRFLKAQSGNVALMAEIQQIDEGLKDLAEGKMLAAIRKNDGQMIRFYLERRARDRGYGQKNELTGPGGGPIQMQPSIDVSKLSLEEQKQMLALHMKAATAEEDQE